MEGNKEEAYRCRELAKKYIKERDYERAINLLNKAERMYPSEENKKLLEDISTLSSSSSSSSPSISAQYPSSQTVSAHDSYTEAQADLCRQVLNAKDYYQLLGVERTATNETIKKAYKKLALQLHPDKNKHPSAEDAFKKVSKSVTCLLDPNKRMIYDTHGEEEPINTLHSRDIHEDISPEQLFEAFFGHSVPRAHQGRTFYFQTRPRRQQSQSGLGALIQFVPIIIFIVFSMLNHMYQSSDKPRFVLIPTPTHNIRMTSSNRSVTYYIDSQTEQEIQKNTISLKKLDYLAELEYYERACYKERERIQTSRHFTSLLSNQMSSQKNPKQLLENCNIFYTLRQEYNQLMNAY